MTFGYTKRTWESRVQSTRINEREKIEKLRKYCANKFDSLDGMDKFLKKWTWHYLQLRVN